MNTVHIYTRITHELIEQCQLNPPGSVQMIAKERLLLEKEGSKQQIGWAFFPLAASGQK